MEKIAGEADLNCAFLKTTTDHYWTINKNKDTLLFLNLQFKILLLLYSNNSDDINSIRILFLD